MRPGCKARKGQYLGIYYGVLVGPDGEDVPDSAYIYSMNSHNGESEYNIDSGMYGNWTRFANSHCNPNVECCPEQIGGIRVLAFSALRTIRENEQILINYGKRYFDELNLLCTCDAFPTPHKTLGHTQRRQNRPGRPPQVDEDEDEEDGESPSSPSSVRSHITVVGPPSEDEEEEEEEDEEDDPLNPMSRYGRRENDLPAYIPRPATKFASGRSFVSGVQNALHNQEVIEVADGVEALNSDEDMEDADEGDEDEDMEDV
ncbi:hypothetical protein QBC41DRAFT_329211 [Cercophora samala]|uniref:SET domain-containing protein n=1 Tax=Cercophora samala TaxID=330535 RepID=A0AA40D7U0_9PEZI|nr:hypothetical protein QBC41DRAFT_329211 [Cercophora samala]